MINREIITTKEGSSTLIVHDLGGETFHSRFGAIQEAIHVYINEGIKRIHKNKINVLEMGFGTGLNAYLTYQYALSENKEVAYTSVEGFPLTKEEWQKLNYQSYFTDVNPTLNYFHEVNWNQWNELNPQFSLMKIHSQFENFESSDTYDIVFFDVFGYDYQPHLWHKTILEKMYNMLANNGVLVTYACKSIVNRTLKEIGFEVLKVKGPLRKREMTIAIKS